MNGPVNGNRPTADEVHLLDYLIVLANHSRMVFFVSAAAMVLAYLILFILPNKYTATARLLPPSQNMTLSGQILDALGGGNTSTGGGAMGGMGGMAATLLGLKTPADLYVGMMSGDTISDRIIEQFNLREEYHARYIEDARNALAKQAKIIVDKKNGIINVEVTSDTPEKAAEMANAYIKELDRLLQEISIQEAKVRLSFVDKERSKTSQNLHKAEETLRSFSEKNSVLQIDAQTRGVLEYIASLRAQIDGKEVGIQVLRQQATPFNFDMVRMETEVKGLREKLRIAETQYDNCITDVCVPTSKAPKLALEYVRLYRELKFQETLYQLFLKLSEIARLDMVRDDAVIQVVDLAKPPEKRSNGRLLPSIAAGMFTFFVLAFVLLGQEHIMNNEDDIRRLTKLKDCLRPQIDTWVRFKNKIWFKRRS
jgi:tyrosine-protein kinase Etk/Wzc